MIPSLAWVARTVQAHGVVFLLLLHFGLKESYASPSFPSWRQCSSQGVYGGLYGAQLVANLTDFRSNLLSQVWSSFDPGVKYSEGSDRFNPYQPFLKCPPHRPLKRYGNPEDGGKLLCDIHQLEFPCLVYSLGSNGDYTFEQDVLNNTKCDVHTFDCTYDGSSIDPRHTYHKTCVGRGGPDFKTWQEITRDLGHGAVDVAKIDIEGHESSLLTEFKHHIPLPKQIVIEMHLRPDSGETAIPKVAPHTPAQLALLMMHMASIGYGIVGGENNQWGEPGCCAEFTFLHVERHWEGLKVLPHETRAEQHHDRVPI